MRLTKKEADRRRRFVTDLAKKDGASVNDIMKAYQKKFGTYIKAERVEEWLHSNGHPVRSKSSGGNLLSKIQCLIDRLRESGIEAKKLERDVRTKDKEIEKLRSANAKLRQEIIDMQTQQKQIKAIDQKVDKALKKK